MRNPTIRFPRPPRGTSRTLIPILVLALASSASANSTYADGPGNCKIVGDSDVFGLGIRLSFYFQWAATVFATWIAPEQVRPAQLMSIVVAISVYVNTLRGISGGSVIAAEWWIVYFMTFVLPLGFVPSDTILLQRPRYGFGLLVPLWAVTVFGQCWLWFGGVDLGRKEGCVVKVFVLLFAIDVDNKAWQTVFKIESVIGCIAVAAFLFCSLVRGFGGMTRGEGYDSGGDGDSDSDSDRDRDDGRSDGEGGDGRENDQRSQDQEGLSFPVKVLLTAFQLLFGAFAVLQIEMTMKVNNIDVSAASLTSSGQLIPFLFGGFTLAATFWAGFKNLMKAA